MIDTRFQDDDILNRLEQELYKTISKAIKISIEPYSTNKAGQLYHSYDIKDIDEEIQNSVYKRMNKLSNVFAYKKLPDKEVLRRVMRLWD